MKELPGLFDTSTAAMPTEEKAKSWREQCLDHLRSCREYGATDDEQQQALDLNPSTQRPRRGELVTKGLAVFSGRYRLTRGKCRAKVWVAKEYAK